MHDPKDDPDVLLFLDRLRASGVTNMFGAGRYVQEAFDLSAKDSRDAVAHWMRTFSDRKARGELAPGSDQRS